MIYKHEHLQHILLDVMFFLLSRTTVIFHILAICILFTVFCCTSTTTAASFGVLLACKWCKYMVVRPQISFLTCWSKNTCCNRIIGNVTSTNLYNLYITKFFQCLLTAIEKGMQLTHITSPGTFVVQLQWNFTTTGTLGPKHILKNVYVHIVYTSDSLSWSYFHNLSTLIPNLFL